MDFSGWEIDLPSLYGPLWEKRARFFLSERLYESPDGAWAVLFFGLGEVGMNKQVGHLGLFRDKTSPILAFHSGETAFWYEGPAGDPVLFTPDGTRAKVLEFVPGRQGRPDHLGLRVRTLDFKTARMD